MKVGRVAERRETVRRSFERSIGVPALAGRQPFEASTRSQHGE